MLDSFPIEMKRTSDDAAGGRSSKKPRPGRIGKIEDGRVVFGPCNLKRNVYNEQVEIVGTKWIQDWLVVEKALGLKWRKSGTAAPDHGRELENAELAKALATKQEFTKQEWVAFGVAELRHDDYIKSGNDYFEPTGKVYETRSREDPDVLFSISEAKSGEAAKDAALGVVSTDSYPEDTPRVPPISADVWLAKTRVVRDAMVENYIRYNFKPYIDGAPKDRSGKTENEIKAQETEAEARVEFCRKEAERLIPHFEGIEPAQIETGPVMAFNWGVGGEGGEGEELSSATNGESEWFTAEAAVNPLKSIASIANVLVFDPHNDSNETKERRVAAYNWETTPLLVNDIEKARNRYMEAWTKADMNIACPVTDNMLPAPQVRAIVDAINRAPSVMTSQSGEHGFIQTWRYSEKSRALVARNDVGEGKLPPPEQLDRWKESFEQVRAAMLQAYVKKWFNTGQLSEDFKLKEAARVVPPFNKWGLQVINPSFKLFPKGKEGDNLRRVYGLQTGGIGIEERLGYLTGGMKVEGNKTAVPLNIPIDVLWVENAEVLVEEARKNATLPKAPKSSMSSILKVIPSESYLRMRLDVLLDRRKREKDHSSALAALKKKDMDKEELARQMSILNGDYNKTNREMTAREDATLQQKLAGGATTAVSDEETEALANLDDTEKVALLRNLYYLELRNFRKRRDEAMERAPVVLQTDAQPMDVDGDEAADQAGDAGFEYSNDMREEIHFAYLARIKDVLRSSEDAEALYNKEMEMIVGRRNEAAQVQFKTLSELTPEGRRDAAAERPQAAKMPRERVSYVDLSFQERMKKDAVQRSRIRTTYEKNKKNDKTAEQKLQTFDKYADMLTAEALTNDQAGKDRRVDIYKSMYQELSDEVEGRKNKRLFSSLMDYVLQQTLKQEWHEFLDARRTESMSADEIKAEQELKKRKERRRIYEAHVKANKIEEAVAVLDEELVDDIKALGESKLEEQRQLIKEFKDELAEAQKDPVFDKLRFGQDVIDRLLEVESEATYEMRRSAKRTVLRKAKLRKQSPTDVAEAKKSTLKYGTPLGQMVQEVSKLEGVEQLVDNNILTLMKNDEQRTGIRRSRNEALEAMYKKLLDELVGKEIKDTDKAIKEMDKVNIDLEIETIREFDKQLAVTAEVVDYDANMGVKRATVLLAFQRFIDSVQEYRSVNNSSTLPEQLRGRRPDPLVEQRDIAEMANAVLDPSFLEHLTIKKNEKAVSVLQRQDYVNMALEWREEQLEKNWYSKETLNESNEEDKKDIEFLSENVLYENDYDEREVLKEAQANMENLYEGFAPANKDYQTWLKEVEKQFEDEQIENLTYGYPQQQATLENLVDFVIVRKVGHHKGSRKVQGRAYELTGFKGKKEADHEFARLEPYQKRGANGEWYTPYYLESNEEVKKGVKGGKPKITDVIHFLEDDLEGVPSKLRPAEKYAWKNRGSYRGEEVDRISYFKPWDGMAMDTEEAKGAQAAWDMAKEALSLSRKGFPIYDLMKNAKDGETTQTIFEKLKEWQQLEFFRLVDGSPENHTDNYKGHIVDVQFPDKYEKQPGDTVDQQVAKNEAKEQWKQFWLFLGTHVYENFEDTAETNEPGMDEDLEDEGEEDEGEEDSEDEGEEENESEEEENGDDNEAGNEATYDGDFSEEEENDTEETNNDEDVKDVGDDKSGEESGEESDEESGEESDRAEMDVELAGSMPAREWWGDQHSWWKK